VFEGGIVSAIEAGTPQGSPSEDQALAAGRASGGRRGHRDRPQWEARGATGAGRKRLGAGICPGAWRGRVRLADDFDDLPDEIADELGVR
jgi:hypothetical protein